MLKSPVHPAAETVHVALLRGINVGGRHKLPMAELAALFVEAGAAAVRTHIQSGNVLFRASPALAAGLPARVGEAIAVRYGFQSPVVLRTAEELAAAVGGNPFLAAGADPAKLHVAFLAEQPAAERAAALDPQRSPPDAFAVRGRDVFLHLPNGVARTRLTNAYLDATLGTVSTLRNWRTVLKLLELAQEG